MKKYNFDISFKGLDGKELPDSNMSNFLASRIAEATKGDAIKLYTIAVKLFNDKVLICDDTDKKVIEQMIKENANINILVKAQLLEVFEKGEEIK